MKTQNTQTSKLAGDDRIKAFCLRNGFAIPTSEELGKFPLKFRQFDGKDYHEKMSIGAELWTYCMTGKHNDKQEKA